MTANDLGIALQHAQEGVQGYDFFGDHSNMRHPHDPPSPYGYNQRQEEQLNYGTNQRGIPHPFGNGHIQNSSIGQNDTTLPELVRRTNLAVSLANHNINPRSQFTQVHPMMCFDGRFPTDFRSPKTVESVKLLDVGSNFTGIQVALRHPLDNEYLKLKSVKRRQGLDQLITFAASQTTDSI
ncbi:conserved hypothetical protein [Microsporum canis CBS 113480]|uniref:Uncharacterized protein n=1 Tax=Arthroderma otae (strain ATCC MYA-4605 / CBS 113480) TaxID=554155 RepID=C5FSA0_ARTOC|nr:conserved hypothetical protein [Microsporum canis CBS 113480]EEQ32753.1 conserved hypothetical protein [Microsporum canis CBS 113480]